MNKQHLLNLQDAANSHLASRKKEAKHQAHDLSCAGALSGAFCSMLFGLIFFVPMIGLGVGVTVEVLTGSMN